MERPMVVIDLQREPRLARDLTKGGVFVSDCGLAINSECSLVVRGPSDELCITARVVFVDGNRGAGLELIGFGAAMRAQLSALLGSPTGVALGSGQTSVPPSDPVIEIVDAPAQDPPPARTSTPRGTDPPLSRTRTPVRAADDDGHVARTRTQPMPRAASSPSIAIPCTPTPEPRAASSPSSAIPRTPTPEPRAASSPSSATPEPIAIPRASTSPSIAIARASTSPSIATPEPIAITRASTSPSIAIPRTLTPEPIAIARTRARSSQPPFAEQPEAHEEAPAWIAAETSPGVAWTGEDLTLLPDDQQPDEAPRPESTERIPLEELLADEPADAPFDLELELLPLTDPPARVVTDEIQTMDDPQQLVEQASDPADAPAPEADPAALAASLEGETDERKRLALNHYERLRGLTLAQAVKKANSVDPGERMILERIYGKNVWEALLRNPRLTPPEVSRIARMGALPRPLLELITGNGAWLQVGEIRRALLSNPRLGTDQILRVLRLVPKHELKLVASQTVYPHAVRDAAKRLVKEMGP